MFQLLSDPNHFQVVYSIFIFLLCFALKAFKYCVPAFLYFQIEISNFLPEKILNSNEINSYQSLESQLGI